MAVRKLDFHTSVRRSLPKVPTERPAVAEARRLLDLARQAHARASDGLRTAEMAANDDGTDAAAEALEALAAGREMVDQDDNAAVHVAACRKRVETTGAAVALAEERHDEALAVARRAFADELLPALDEAVNAVRVAAERAVELNEAAQRLAAFGNDNDPDLPPPWLVTFSMLTRDRVAAAAESIEANLHPAPAAGPPAGTILVEMTQDVTPYAKGETVAIDAELATLWSKALLCRPVYADDARALGVDRLAQFEKPQTIRLTKMYVHKDGTLTSAGATMTFDPVTASRVVNLEYGETLGPADADD